MSYSSLKVESKYSLCSNQMELFLGQNTDFSRIKTELVSSQNTCTNFSGVRILPFLTWNVILLTDASIPVILYEMSLYVTVKCLLTY